MYLKKFLNLKNKNILITGGMGNLGKSFIIPLLELGSFIIICDKLPISKFNKYLKEIDNQYKNKLGSVCSADKQILEDLFSKNNHIQEFYDKIYLLEQIKHSIKVNA